MFLHFNNLFLDSKNRCQFVVLCVIVCLRPKLFQISGEGREKQKMVFF